MSNPSGQEDDPPLIEKEYEEVEESDRQEPLIPTGIKILVRDESTRALKITVH